MKKRIKLAFVILCLVTLLLPLLLTTTEEGAVSKTDGRTLETKPAFGDDGYTLRMESWLRDRLGLRDTVINAYAVTNDRLFGELINPLYQYGKKGQVFFKIHNNIQYNDFHEQFVRMVANIQDYCESRGTKFYYVFNPEKEMLYKEYLPTGVNYNDLWVDKMLLYMKQLGVNYIDLREPLDNLADGEDIFSRQFDAGQWSSTGAFYGMQEITKSIHNDIPEVSILKKSEYDVSSTIAEKLYGSNQIFNFKIPQYKLKAGYSDMTGDLESELIRSDSDGYFKLIQNDSKEASGIGCLLLFQDVLYEPFASARAKETAVLTCFQNVIDFDYYYNIFKPDVVVFENMERVINDNSFRQTSMELAVNNPSILKIFPENSFIQRRDRLLADTEMFEYTGKVFVTPGFAIDKVKAYGIPDNIKYAYIITDDKVIDLKADADGNYTADVRRGDIPEVDLIETDMIDVDEESTSEYDEAVLYTLDESGRGRYSRISVTYTGPVPEHTGEE